MVARGQTFSPLMLRQSDSGIGAVMGFGTLHSKIAATNRAKQVDAWESVADPLLDIEPAVAARQHVQPNL